MKKAKAYMGGEDENLRNSTVFHIECDIEFDDVDMDAEDVANRLYHALIKRGYIGAIDLREVNAYELIDE